LTWILNCLTVQHDWRLTLLAVVVCVVGLATAIALIGMARQRGRAMRLGYGAAAATVGGMAVWATHFLAMLGYKSDAIIGYAVPETLGSLAVVIVGLGLAVAVALSRRSRLTRLIVAGMGAASGAAMHFIGMSSVRIQGGDIAWNEPAVAVVVGLSALAGLTSVLWTKNHGRWRIPAIIGSATVSVVILHFGGMSAMTIYPHPGASLPDALVTETGMLTWAVGGATIVILIAAIVTALGLLGRTSALTHLREAIDAMPDGLAFYDGDDRLVIWNARYAEVNPEVAGILTVGLRFRDMLKAGLAQGLYPEAVGREQEWMQERITARRSLSNTMEIEVAGARWLRVQDRRTATRGIVTVVNDITDLKRDAAALSEARDTAESANRAKSEFLANMSHEIRTPLNGVIGLTQALARTPLADDQREMLDLIQSSGHTLQTLLSDILDLARVESGRLEISDEPFDLARAVNDAAQLYSAPAADKGLQFFIEIDPAAEIWVRGDVVRLKQILTNLVSNAVKFTNNGFVSLTAGLGSDRGGVPLMRFTVEDTGVGFDAAAKARLFTRFEQADGSITRRFGGTGLGLAISRQLVEMMGGSLDCESEPGGGSAFILTLPLVQAEAPAIPVPQDALDDVDATRIRVLVADDHPTNRKVVELILSQAPIDLVQAENGAEAVEACRSQVFDLVLMDMQMPVMDGLAAVREIRLHEIAAGRERAPIVMLTANALPDHIAAGQAAGADRHLAKPFDAAELLALVAELGGEARSSIAA
jgi:signal transduction histidine kinase/NO-binding membrane sensor protein with MHYT domain/ActR/RegA family two-component response regulator